MRLLSRSVSTLRLFSILAWSDERRLGINSVSILQEIVAIKTASERAIINPANAGTVSKTLLGKTLRNKVPWLIRYHLELN